MDYFKSKTGISWWIWLLIALVFFIILVVLCVSIVRYFVRVNTVKFVTTSIDMNNEYETANIDRYEYRDYEDEVSEMEQIKNWLHQTNETETLQTLTPRKEGVASIAMPTIRDDFDKVYDAM